VRVLVMPATSIGNRKGQGVSKISTRDDAWRNFCVRGQFE
jgi:hypothetical protein